MATELTVKLPNRPGQLAAVAKALGDKRVNIASLSASTAAGKGVVHLVFADKDAGAARRALKAAKYRVSGDRKLLEIRLANKPGTLARAASRLAKAKVNIDTAYMVAQGRKSSTLGVGVRSPAAAKRALR